MTKLTKHSPHQTETEPSIVSQVPKDLQAEFLQGLVDLAQSRRGSPDPQFKPMDQASYQDVARVDPPNGLLSQVPKR